jgi:Protein of unknown function (DUF3024)
MAIDIFKTLEVIEVMENFVERRRPPENIRHELDLSYTIDNQSIIVFEIRPRWDNPSETLESPIAKTTYVKSANHWKVFWMRADLKWHPYPPQTTVASLVAFTKLLDEDKHHCFWG